MFILILLLFIIRSILTNFIYLIKLCYYIVNFTINFDWVHIVLFLFCISYLILIKYCKITRLILVFLTLNCLILYVILFKLDFYFAINLYLEIYFNKILGVLCLKIVSKKFISRYIYKFKTGLIKSYILIWYMQKPFKVLKLHFYFEYLLFFFDKKRRK